MDTECNQISVFLDPWLAEQDVRIKHEGTQKVTHRDIPFPLVWHTAKVVLPKSDKVVQMF